MIPKVSVIIPVHNGRKTLKRTLKSVLGQKYDNYEVIVIENGSTDGTWEMLKSIAQNERKICIWKNDVVGTVHARHKGVQLATGEYITFIDADDKWINENALSEMVRYILSENAPVVQFGFYKDYKVHREYCGLKRKRIIRRKALLSKEIAATMGANNFELNNYVWNKIYNAEILKTAFVLPDRPLIYSEDMYLNLCMMFDDRVDKIVIVPEAFVLYLAGIGISSNMGVGKKLFEEYCITKSMALDLAKSKGTITTYPIYRAHRESLYFYRALIIGMIRDNVCKEKVVSKIKEIEKYSFVKEAKRFLSEETDEELEQETIFLSGQYTPEQYYEHCKGIAGLSSLARIKMNVKKTGRHIMKRFF